MLFFRYVINATFSKKRMGLVHLMELIVSPSSGAQGNEHEGKTRRETTGNLLIIVFSWCVSEAILRFLNPFQIGIIFFFPLCEP